MTQSLASTGLGAVSSVGGGSMAVGGVRPAAADPAAFLAAMNALAGGEGNLGSVRPDLSVDGAGLAGVDSKPAGDLERPSGSSSTLGVFVGSKSVEPAVAVAGAGRTLGAEPSTGARRERVLIGRGQGAKVEIEVRDESLESPGLGRALEPAAPRLGSECRSGRPEPSPRLSLVRVDPAPRPLGLPSPSLLAQGGERETGGGRAGSRRIPAQMAAQMVDFGTLPYAEGAEVKDPRPRTSESESPVAPVGVGVPIVSLLEKGTQDGAVSDKVATTLRPGESGLKTSAAEPTRPAAVGETIGRGFETTGLRPVGVIECGDSNPVMRNVEAGGSGWARVTLETASKGLAGGQFDQGLIGGGTGTVEPLTGSVEMRALGVLSASGWGKMETSKIQHANQVIRGSVASGGERQEVPSASLGGLDEEVEKFLAPESNGVDRRNGLPAEGVQAEKSWLQTKLNKPLVINDLSGSIRARDASHENAIEGPERMNTPSGTPGAQGDMAMKNLGPELEQRRGSEGSWTDGGKRHMVAGSRGAVGGSERAAMGVEVQAEVGQWRTGRGGAEFKDLMTGGNEGGAAVVPGDGADLVVAGAVKGNSAGEAMPASAVSVGDRIEQVERLLTREAASFRERGLEPVSIVLRPDSSTELRLDLRNEGGILRAEVTLERGDLRSIGGDWEQLQARLEERGIRLGALTTEPGLGSGSGGFGSMQERRDASAGPDVGWVEDGGFGGQRRAKTAAIGAALVGAASAAGSVELDRRQGTRWESWA